MCFLRLEFSVNDRAHRWHGYRRGEEGEPVLAAVVTTPPNPGSIVDGEDAAAVMADVKEVVAGDASGKDAPPGVVVGVAVAAATAAAATAASAMAAVTAEAGDGTAATLAAVISRDKTLVGLLGEAAAGGTKLAPTPVGDPARMIPASAQPPAAAVGASTGTSHGAAGLVHGMADAGDASIGSRVASGAAAGWEDAPVVQSGR